MLHQESPAAQKRTTAEDSSQLDKMQTNNSGDTKKMQHKIQVRPTELCQN